MSLALWGMFYKSAVFHQLKMNDVNLFLSFMAHSVLECTIFGVVFVDLSLQVVIKMKSITIVDLLNTLKH